MLPKEKAGQLFDIFQDAMPSASWYEEGKNCALIAVNEIMKELDEQFQGFASTDREMFWKQVKQEIEKL